MILEGAAPQLDKWRDDYVDQLTVNFPTARVSQVGSTITVARRGQQVWIGLSKRDETDVRIVTEVRSGLRPAAAVLFVCGLIFLIGYGSSLLSFSYAYNSGCPTCPLEIIGAMFFWLFVFWGGAAVLARANYAEKTQVRALEIARATWQSIAGHAESEMHDRPQHGREIPPQFSTNTLARPATAKFCVSCGARLSEGARFCPYCGNNVHS